MSNNALPPPRNAQEAASGMEVQFQAEILHGRAGLALLKDPSNAEAMMEFRSARRIMEQMNNTMSRAAAQGGAARDEAANPQRLERREGVTRTAPDLPQGRQRL